MTPNADSGQTFTARATGLSSGGTEFQSVAAPGRTGGLWLSLKGDGLCRSTDGGATFTEVSSCHASHTPGFGKAARGAFHPALSMVGATDAITAVHRSDDEAKTWTRFDDDRHPWGWTKAAATGDPRVCGRGYIAADGRGVQYGEPA
ncbi:hypothetical protein QFZ56_005764 [Streptomyces achromogenes]|uniref:Exo-alpha-sialidase n=1 Tax=Streptomyces achromogenes TaxID=67255 RepID=A0ABU0Q9E4_STRAH|nr:hypothetical protein [Streptomyces achromogenes]